MRVHLDELALRGFKPAKITVHSANSSARDKMIAGIHAIERMVRKVWIPSLTIASSERMTAPLALHVITHEIFNNSFGRTCRALREGSGSRDLVLWPFPQSEDD